MRIRLPWGFVLLLAASAATPCWAQAPELMGPFEEGFFGLGWSPNGERLAYGWFMVTQMVSNGSRIAVKAQDLVSDKVLWRLDKKWEQGNVGEGGNGSFPATAPEAWQHIASDVSKRMAALGIKTPAPAKPAPFPYASEGDQVTIEVMAEDGQAPYEIWAVSEKLGRKRIAGGNRTDKYMEMRPEGFFLSPDGNRMAVVVRMVSTQTFPYYEVIGCHLRTGFKKAAATAPAP